MPHTELPFATVDLDRQRRCGFPEVVYSEGKTPEWVEGVLRRLAENGQDAFATRVNAEQAAHLAAAIPQGIQDRLARTFCWKVSSIPTPSLGKVEIVTAGTSDLPVAEEAAVTATAMGNTVARLTDVGVAGIHRILAQQDALMSAAIVIVIAGMDGALASVVGGLVRVPVIAVPTSVGYGASFGGLSALLGMLNSCASGVTVVNIDNGFGAGFAASRINQLHSQTSKDEPA